MKEIFTQVCENPKQIETKRTMIGGVDYPIELDIDYNLPDIQVKDDVGNVKHYPNCKIETRIAINNHYFPKERIEKVIQEICCVIREAYSNVK